MIKAKSLTENASIAFTRQRSLESRTMGTATEFSLYFPQSPSSPIHPSPSQFHSVPLSHIRSATLPSSRNDHIIRIPSVPVTQKVKCDESQERTRENLTALSLEIMRHAEKLKSLLNSAKESEILEIVSRFVLWIRFDIFPDGLYDRKCISTRLKVRSYLLNLFIDSMHRLIL